MLYSDTNKKYRFSGRLAYTQQVSAMDQLQDLSPQNSNLNTIYHVISAKTIWELQCITLSKTTHYNKSNRILILYNVHCTTTLYNVHCADKFRYTVMQYNDG